MNQTPRQIVKGLLEGLPPPRPLWLPIVFSRGARMENLPLRTFLGNATKISNSARLIRGHVGSDGLACYFDPFLEAEALGATLDWSSEDQPPVLRWSGRAPRGEMPQGLRSPEDAVTRGRIGIAVEVIRRLKSIVRDDSLLMAGVTGPFTLAARIMQLGYEHPLAFERFSDAALSIAASLMTLTSTAFVEAGANVIFMREEVLPRLADESCEAWAARLAPAVNIIRFYQALPVLHIKDPGSFAQNSEVILRRHWDCVICPSLGKTLRLSSGIPPPGGPALGLALPLESLRPGQTGDYDIEGFLHYAVSEAGAAILTTADDVPPGSDMSRLTHISKSVRLGGSVQ